MVIHPQIFVTPDRPTIQFYQPREQVNLEVQIPRILHAQGWGCGIYFNVQFVSHDKKRLLASALFVVSEEMEALTTSEDQYRPVTRTIFNRKASQVGEWWVNLEGEVVEVIADGTEADVPTTPGTEVLKRRGRPPKLQPNQPA